MRFVKTLGLWITLAAAAPGLHAQDKPASGPVESAATATAAKAALQAVKPADKPVAAKPTTASPSSAQHKPAPPAANKQPVPAAKQGAPAPVAKTSTQATKPSSPVKPAPKRAANKPARKPAKSAASAATSSPAADKEVRVAKRDPFESLIGRERGSSGPTGPLPAGKPGLQISSLRLDGIVRAPNGMIAVVSNPQSRTYFLREGDQLYDGRVEKIAMDGVSFHEIGKDAFGKPVERQVNKRIYASAGEQQ